MALTLVLGPANSAKAGEVLGAYSAAAQRGALLIVPTVADARHYGRELAEQGCVMASVMTFAGLAEEIARRSGYYERRLTRIQRERALERAVRAARLGVLSEAAETKGFAAAAGELAAELERALVTPARFAQAMRKWGEEDRRRSDLARDIGSLYLAYRDELERLGRVDPELFLWRGLDALRGSPDAWGSTPVFFYGFDDLTRLERDAIETLSRVAGAEVTVSLTYEIGRAALSARAGLVEELGAAGGGRLLRPRVPRRTPPSRARPVRARPTRADRPGKRGPPARVGGRARRG
jgi:ATP-dependent helicase/DNAse subunit B